MTQYAVLAAQEAIAQANITPELLSGGRLGVCAGSTLGSVDAIEEFFTDYLQTRSLDSVRSTLFFKVMGHTVASNLAQALGITGRLHAPSAACATGCQAIGMAYETIVSGSQDIMLCGGADEFSVLTAATFDLMNAASSRGGGNPAEASKPFDLHRDGIVCSEGAGILVLESLENAKIRGAVILGEVAGFATNSSPGSIANPDSGAIKACMEEALHHSCLPTERIEYISSHATGTEQGDIAEGKAIEELFGSTVPVSSLKGHMGHTMAASGALECIATLRMMQEECVIPTLNLNSADPACGNLNLPITPHPLTIGAFIKNSFALGGVNSVLVVRSFE
jgi:3-oxoacyl-[acyl-carrier-protein] synthase II